MTLMGERSSGSRWGIEMTASILENLPWKEITEEDRKKDENKFLDFCKYYHLTKDDMYNHLKGSTQYFKTLGECQDCGFVIEIQDGAHGKELVSPDIIEEHCNTAWLIIGPAQSSEGHDMDGKMVWTCYPGDITEPLPKEWDNVEDLPKGVAVKGI